MIKIYKIKKFISLTLLITSISGLIINQNNIDVNAFPYSDMELAGSETRTLRGSNYWLSSNLREWLNSDDKNVRYTCNPPSSAYVNNYPYDKEAGFLTGFTQEEKNAIAITERGNVFGGNDTKANTNGKTGGMTYNHNNSKSINFEYPNLMKNWANYGQVVANDKIFLLTFKEITEYVQNRGWDVTKTPSSKVTEKFGYSSNTKLPYYIYHPIHDIGNERLEIVSDNPNSISMDTNPLDARGIAPAMHLKKDVIVKRVKEYDIYNINESWITRTKSVKASDLNIGDIIEFGTHLGNPIEWRVINKTDSGYPLLLSENVIDIKAFDGKGDTARRFSYIDLEDKFKTADVSTKSFQISNVQNSVDKKPVSVELLNEDKLFERSNDSFIMNLKVTDDSGVAYVLFPDGNKINVNKTEFTFNYEVGANGNYVFGLMDIKGNFRYFVLPVGNINLPPKVDISSTTSDWANGNVSVDIKATNDVGWQSPAHNQSSRDIVGGYWGNYTTYIGKRIRVTGKVEYVSDKNNFNPSSFSYGPGFMYKSIAKSGDEYTINWTWPIPWSENLNTLKQRKLNGEPPKEFDFIYTVGSDYFGNFTARTHINLTALSSGNTTIKWTNLKFELLDNSDFAITKIELPNGQSVNASSYRDTITTEGETVYSYKVHDSRNMITEKTITAKIDKTKPTINVANIPTTYTKEDVILNIDFSDSLSGIKEVLLPNGRISGDGKKEISIEYPVSENGQLTFVVTDMAGNSTTKVVNTDKIDKINPTITYTKEVAANKLSGFINISLSDNLSDIDYLVLPDNTKVYNVSNYKYPIKSNGNYYFLVYDKAGNKNFVNVSVNELLTNITPSEIDRIEYKLEGATIQNWTVYNSPFIITNEGITTIRARAYDKAGNLSDEKTSIVKIDKTKPINNSIIIQLK